ncbi:MAG: pirin family protein [Sarcina sp.]
MIKVNKYNNMGKSELGWLSSKFHFSFAEYFNPMNMNFGALRVLNDDLIQPHTGFGTHPHRDMEIVSYVVDGKLSHKDSMGNENTIGRGDVQYMSAGTGVTHSEMNNGDETVRLLQIWILPDARDYKPNYGDYRFKEVDRQGKWLHMVSSFENNVTPINVHQDVNIYSLELNEGEVTTFDVEENRQAYLVQIEGKSVINKEILEHGDSLEVIGENINIEAKEKSHYLLIEMRKSI